MSMRKVRSNGRTVVGLLSSLKKGSVQFESSLEEEFLYIVDFDSHVKTFHDQPVTISYKDKEGLERKYTPDFLVEYFDRKPVLFEVKYQEYLDRAGRDLEPAFNAAARFAKGKSWDFNVITDKEIRTEYCRNVRFLHRYQTQQFDLLVLDKILTSLVRTGRTTPARLVKELSHDREDYPIYISAIWALVLKRKIACNLFNKIHMETEIWLAETEDFKELTYPYQLC